MPDVPPFSLDRPYYDPATYTGRVLNFWQLIDPRRLFVTDSELSRCRRMLDEFKSGKATAGAAELWRARRTLEATLHPDTGEKVFLPFRACAFVPANVPIAAGMLLSAPTVPNAILWQWMNQSFNAGFNYANRPISKDAPDALGDTAVAYASATAVSCSIAVGLGQFVKRATAGGWYSPSVLRGVGVAVPFIAVAGAGSFNVVAMRAKELTDGISVFAPGESGALGDELGKSQAAARAALGQCVLSRITLPMPVLLFPPFVMPVARSAFPKFAATRLGGVTLDLAVLTGFLFFAVPLALGLFPQLSSLGTSSLEEDLRRKAEARGCTYVLYNKGL
eukprot:TRINITY_DN22336_c0_g1_i1.p2 TRINITY_DN22336_c0_g1~~TRINITY_DN22336_c0_g1_i1.p2  ORF type:complete len:361 (+),score=130.41 TRINITY_DN22336_c0_g1_i1:80-1084(+)